MTTCPKHLIRRLAAMALMVGAASSAFGVNSFDSATNLLTLDSVSVGGSTYYNVAVTVDSYDLLGVAGGAAGASTFNTSTNSLFLGSVAYQGTVYTNVSIKINAYRLHSTAPAATPGTLGTSTYTNEIAVYLSTLNNYRTQCGIPTLAQNTVLDSVAFSVGIQEGSNLNHPNTLSASVGYAVPHTAGGVRSTYRSGSANKDAVGLAMLNTTIMDPSAMLNLFRPYTDIGMAYDLQTTGGISRGARTMYGNPAARNLPSPVTFPCANTTNVPPYGTTFVGGVYFAAMAPTGLTTDYIEWINGSQGTPIAVFANPGQTMVLTGASVTLRGGMAVPVTLKSNHRTIYPYEGFVWPRQNLLPNSTYDVVIYGTVDGAAFSKQFAFKTGDAIPLAIP